MRIRVLTNGTSVLSFPLVTTETHFKGDQSVEHSEWHQVIMWNGLAIKAQTVLVKGLLVCIEGCIKTRSFLDQQNIKHYLTEIVASSYVKMT